MEFFAHAKIGNSMRKYSPPRVANDPDRGVTSYMEHKTLQYNFCVVDNSGKRPAVTRGEDFYSRQPLQSLLAYK